MQLQPLGRGGAPAQHLGHQRVREPVRAALDDHQSGLDRRCQPLLQLRRTASGHRGQQDRIDAVCRARVERGGRSEHGLGRVRQPVEPPFQHRAHPAGHRADAPRRTLLQPALRAEQPHDLGGEVRVAARAAVERLEETRRQHLAGELGHRGPQLVHRQAAEGQPPVGRDRGDAAGLGVAVGAEDEHRRRDVRAERRQQVQRRVVGPVQVVEDQQDRRHRLQRGRHRLHHQEASVVGGRRVGCGERLGPAEPSQELGPGPERRSAPVPRTRRPRHRDPVGPQPFGDLRRQARLADAGVAADQGGDSAPTLDRGRGGAQ
jgi:hypothetical protein